MIAAVMLEEIVTGIVQGISEWLPLSSDGLIVLVKTNVFHNQSPLGELMKYALFLHTGTLLAAVIYFRRTILDLFRAFLRYPQADAAQKKMLQFLFASTIISGLLGLAVLKLLSMTTAEFTAHTKGLTLTVGLLLLVTAFLQMKAHGHTSYRATQDLTWIDAVILGIAQGLAALPGLSRSGLTVSALLLSKFEKSESLKISFLMSIPIIFLGNVVLNYKYFLNFTPQSLLGVLSAFIFGMMTIHWLLKLAEKINFGYFVLILGLLTIASTVIH